MLTRIESVHEETTTGENEKTIGLLYNFTPKKDFKDSLVYIFNDKNYIFFETMIDMFDYMYYGDKTKIKRAYMPESEFDEYLDSSIEGSFSDHLEWLSGE